MQYLPTAAGAVGGTTLIDNALKAEEADWIFNRCWARITEGVYANDERKITSLAPTTGTLTCLAFDGQIDSGIDYEIHRLFSPADKRQALIDSAKLAYPYLYTAVRDESQVAGNWLRNGDLETWTSTDYPDYWRVSDVTAAASTTAKTLDLSYEQPPHPTPPPPPPPPGICTRTGLSTTI